MIIIISTICIIITLSLFSLKVKDYFLLAEPLKTRATKAPPQVTTLKPKVTTTKKPTTQLPVTKKPTTGAPLPVNVSTPGTTTSQTTTYQTIDSPFRSTDSLVPIALAVAMGTLVVILLIVFAALWICRRNSIV